MRVTARNTPYLHVLVTKCEQEQDEAQMCYGFVGCWCIAKRSEVQVQVSCYVT